MFWVPFEACEKGLLKLAFSHVSNFRGLDPPLKCTEGAVAKLCSCKIESTKTKQAITNTIDGWKCLKKTKLVNQKKQPNGTVQSVKLMFIFMHP
jgi:hypothetical protein